MLTPQDDFIGHQLPTTFDHVGTSDPAWMERLWYTGHIVPAGDIIFDLGLGYHPNRNVMDAFAGVAIGGKQYNLRLSRRLRPNALTTEVGPLRITILEGLRRHRLELAENESGISFDIEFQASMNPHEEADHFRRRHGRVAENLARAQQLGRYSGWLKVAGQRFEIKPEHWCGQRDHSWGIRAEMRTDPTRPPMSYYPPLFYTWTTVQFENYGLHWFFNERAPGDTIYMTGEEVLRPGEKANRGRLLEGVSHEMIWADDPHGQTLERAEFELRFADGSRRNVQIRTLPGRYFLKGGGYGGLNGWAFGDDKGQFYMEHDVWDLSDPATRVIARTIADHVIEIRDGANVGYGIMEYGVSKGYPKYEAVQHHPVF